MILYIVSSIYVSISSSLKFTCILLKTFWLNSQTFMEFHHKAFEIKVYFDASFDWETNGILFQIVSI